MLCRGFGRRLPLFAGGAVVALGCAMALRIGPNATYWADIFPAILLLSLGMSLAIAPLTTLVLTSVESDRAGTAAGVNSAVSRVGSLFAIDILEPSVLLGVAQKSVRFYWRNATESFLEGEIDALSIVRFNALLSRAPGGLHKFSKLGSLERALFSPI